MKNPPRETRRAVLRRSQAMPAVMVSVVVMVPPVVMPPMMVVPVEARWSPISVRSINASVRHAMTPAIDMPTRTAAPADFSDCMRRARGRCRRKRLRCGCHAKKAGGEQCRYKNLHLFLRAVECPALKNIVPEREMKRVAHFGHICPEGGGGPVNLGSETDRQVFGAADCALAQAPADLYNSPDHTPTETFSRRMLACSSR